MKNLMPFFAFMTLSIVSFLISIEVGVIILTIEILLLLILLLFLWYSNKKFDELKDKN